MSRAWNLSSGILIGDALVAAQLRQGAQHRVALQTLSLEQLLERGPAFIDEAEQQMFGAGVIVLELARGSLGGIQHFLEMSTRV